MKIMRRIIEIDEEKCDGCGVCVPSCAEGSLVVVDGKARVVAENLCDGLGACLNECPRGALRIVEREAEAFDEGAVERHLEATTPGADPRSREVPVGCPSAGVRMFAPREAGGGRGADAEPAAGGLSALSHWPVQIRLVPPTAPFLKGAELLVLADCGAVAFPNLHGDLLRGRVVVMGCPKFDDTAAYVEKFEQIFRQAGIRKVMAVYMEVPCCAALPVIVEKGMKAAGVQVPVETLMVSVRGEVLKASPGA